MYYLVSEIYTKTTDATDLEIVGWTETTEGGHVGVDDWLRLYTIPRPFSAKTMREATSGTYAIKLDARTFMAEVRRYDQSLCVPPPGWVHNPSNIEYAERLLQERALRSIFIGGDFHRAPNNGVLFVE